MLFRSKVVIIGGEAEFEFGRGQIIKPYKIIFAGKCALVCGKEDVPIDKILFECYYNQNRGRIFRPV